MWLEDHFGSGSTLQRNERVKLAASFWNNVGVGMVIGGIAAAFFLDKPQGAWTKIGIAIAGLALGWLCYSIASNITQRPKSAARAAGATDLARASARRPGQIAPSCSPRAGGRSFLS
jgi:F0F1-type ATP synthase assembly protein I